MKRMIAFIIFVCVSHTAFAQNAKSELVDKLSGYHTMTAHFHQGVYDKEGQKQGHSKGKMAIKRPDNFRWEIKAPYQQVMIANGKSLWIYDKNLEQVSIRALNTDNRLNPASLLSGDIHSYINQFDVEKVSKDGGQAYCLKPKEDKGMINAVTLLFHKGTLKKMWIVDQFGKQNKYKFYDIKMNPKLAPSRFELNIPKGVDVIDNRDGTT